MGRFLFCIFVVLFVVYENEARVFTRCELAKELEKNGIPRNQINNYVCFIENNSLDSEWTGGPYGDGTKNFGLFQLNTNDWCVIGRPGGICNIDCNKLADDDITDDIRCAKEVHTRYGFDPWWVWRSHCRSGVTDVSSCLTGGSGGSPGGGAPGGGGTGDFDDDFDV